MLDQELASIIKYILTATGNPAPYYKRVPQGFFVPAVYFPQPFIESESDTLSGFALEYAWYLKVFHVDSPEAHSMAFNALNSLRAARCLVPLIDKNGEHVDRFFRIDDVSAKTIDDGVAELTLKWKSRRPYAEDNGDSIKKINLKLHTKNAFENAIKGDFET